MTSEEIKLAVREKYGTIARESGSCCNCGCGSDDAEVSVKMSDSYANANEQIVGTADMGLGCGTPTAFAELKQGMVVLDLGSGAGIDVFLAAREVGPAGKVIGLDMTDEMLAKARQNKEKLGIDNVEFRKGDIENMPVDSDTVDYILSNCVLNLVPDKSRAFAEMFRVLKPGGKFTVSDIVTVGDIPPEIRADMSLWAGCIAGAIDREEYVGTARTAGFEHLEVIKEKPFPNDYGGNFRLLSITLSGTK